MIYCLTVGLLMTVALVALELCNSYRPCKHDEQRETDTQSYPMSLASTCNPAISATIAIGFLFTTALALENSEASLTIHRGCFQGRQSVFENMNMERVMACLFSSGLVNDMLDEMPSKTSFKLRRFLRNEMAQERTITFW